MNVDVKKRLVEFVAGNAVSETTHLDEQTLDEIFSLNDFDPVKHILLFEKEGGLDAFCLIDPWDNVCVAMRVPHVLNEMEGRLFSWLERIASAKSVGKTDYRLDTPIRTDDVSTIELFERHDFAPSDEETILFTFGGAKPPNEKTPGFTLLSFHDSALTVESLVRGHNEAFGTNHMTPEYRRAMMAAVGYDGDLDIVLIGADGTIVGSSLSAVLNNGVGEIQVVWVAPSCRGQGLGKYLCRESIRLLTAKGVNEIRLGALSTDMAALKTYRAVGFVEKYRKKWYFKIYNNGSWSGQWMK